MLQSSPLRCIKMQKHGVCSLCAFLCRTLSSLSFSFSFSLFLFLFLSLFLFLFLFLSLSFFLSFFLVSCSSLLVSSLPFFPLPFPCSLSRRLPGAAAQEHPQQRPLHLRGRHPPEFGLHGALRGDLLRRARAAGVPRRPPGGPGNSCGGPGLKSF